MKPFGAKSFSVLISVLGLIAALHYTHALDREKLSDLSNNALFTIGLFGILFSMLIYHFLSLSSPSKSFFRFTRGAQLWDGEQVVLQWGKYSFLIGSSNQTKIKDFRPVLMRLFSMFISLSVCLLCFDSRTVRLISVTPKRLISAGNRFCPEINSQAQAELKKPGCELMYRAHKLGFVKDLGSCGSETNSKLLELCTLRQKDEPYLHYSARLFLDFKEGVDKKVGDPELKERVKATLYRQLEHTGALTQKLKNVVKSTPKASHHIYTNLPFPRGALSHYWNNIFEPRDCLTRFRKPTTSALSESENFEAVYGQLLFNTHYLASVGNCQEYFIHWDSPIDSCQRLAENAVKFLKSTGAYNDAKTVLERHKEEQAYLQLQYQLALLPTLSTKGFTPPSATSIKKFTKHMKPERSFDQIVSFQCLMKVDRAEDRIQKTYAAQIFDQRFQIKETKYLANTTQVKTDIELYRAFTQLLVNDFHYSGYLSSEGVSQLQSWTPTAETFTRASLPLTQLEYLKTIDVFMGHDWIHKHSDLMEIYPYYHHLYNFIDLFRKKYQVQKARL